MIKKGDYFPFIQTYCVCEISIFHPFVYPAYRPPVPFDELSSEPCEDSNCERDDTVCEIKEHQHKEPTVHRHKHHEEDENAWVPNVFAGIFGAENCGTDTRPRDSNSRRKTSQKGSDGPQRSLICGADTRSKENEEYKQAPLRVRRRKRSSSKYDDDEYLRSNRSKESQQPEKRHRKKEKEPSFQDEMSFEDKGYANKSEQSNQSNLK